MTTGNKPLRNKLRAAKFTEEENKKIERRLKKEKTNFTDWFRGLVLKELSE